MADFELVFGVVIMFMVRIGLPLILLLVVGTLIERWQTQHHNDNHQQPNA